MTKPDAFPSSGADAPTDLKAHARRPKPHDALFRHTFGQPSQTAALLRATLPAEVTTAMRLDSLELQPGSFVDAELRETESDLLFRVQLGERPTFLYVLLEHQSTVDARMPWRVLRSMTRVWEAWTRDHPGWQRLPAIIPVVVAHPEQPWREPTNFAALMDVHDLLRAALGPLLVDFRFLLDDLTKQSSDSLRARTGLPALARLTLFLLQRARRSEDLLSELGAWLPELRQVVEGPRDDLAALLVYIRLVTKLAGEQVRAFFRKQLHASEDVMSSAEHFVTQMAPLLRELERDEGRRDQVLSMMQRRYGELTDEQAARVRNASNDELDEIGDRLLEGKPLEEVLG